MFRVVRGCDEGAHVTWVPSSAAHLVKAAQDWPDGLLARLLGSARVRPATAGQVTGNGGCHHQGVVWSSMRSTHFTHQYPRRPGATKHSGNPCRLTREFVKSP